MAPGVERCSEQWPRRASPLTRTIRSPRLWFACTVARAWPRLPGHAAWHMLAAGRQGPARRGEGGGAGPLAHRKAQPITLSFSISLVPCSLFSWWLSFLWLWLLCLVPLGFVAKVTQDLAGFVSGSGVSAGRAARGQQPRVPLFGEQSGSPGVCVGQAGSCGQRDGTGGPSGLPLVFSHCPSQEDSGDSRGWEKPSSSQRVPADSCHNTEARSVLLGGQAEPQTLWSSAACLCPGGTGVCRS